MTRARRSVLICPGGNPRMVAKAATLPADEVILDLEDAVASGEKAQARMELAGLVETLDFGTRTLAVRVNRVGTPEGLRDLLELVVRIGARLDCVVVPKVASLTEVGFVDHCLSSLEAEVGLERRIGIELQIEDPAGLEAASDLAASSTRLEALIFGPGDFAAAMGMPQLTIGGAAQDYPGDIWHYPLYRIAVAARARGLQVIDGPYSQITDPDGLERACRRGAALGLDGKWAIHPSQLEVVNRIFTPSAAQLERASAVLQRVSAEGGASGFDGEMVDEATRRMAEAILARGVPGTGEG
ncbi:MAG: HpcH/HpaI aldolase/citrate lyase family protein [Candidatus Dormibacteria bacterium]